MENGQISKRQNLSTCQRVDLLNGCLLTKVWLTEFDNVRINLTSIAHCSIPMSCCPRQQLGHLPRLLRQYCQAI